MSKAIAIRRVPSWDATKPLVEAVRYKLVGEARRLSEVLEQSRRRLHPLTDPFDLDLGLHRRLSGEREEAYSDWLQWVIEQLQGPSEVMMLLGIDPPPDIGLWQFGHPEISREFWVPQGHAGSTGRLDILIRYGSKAVIAIELKRVGAEESDTVKHEGYNTWLNEQTQPYRYAIFIATTAAAKEYINFRFVSWSLICARLRRIAAAYCQSNRVMVAALMLAFVAAIEQNLLSFSAAQVRNICDGRVGFFNPDVIDHIAKSLNPEA